MSLEVRRYVAGFLDSLAPPSGRERFSQMNAEERLGFSSSGL